MSLGPGLIESRIADLFAATRDRALSIDEITDNAYALGGRKPTRAQRLSATRAAHRVLRRVAEMDKRADKLRAEAKANTEAALGRPAQHQDPLKPDDEYSDRLHADPASRKADKLADEVHRIGVWLRFGRDDRPGYIKCEVDYWCTATIKGRLFFYPPDAPLQVWAVSIQPVGVIWVEAEVRKITEEFVTVRYAGVTARLGRRALYRWWAWWRGVMFVSSAPDASPRSSMSFGRSVTAPAAVADRPSCGCRLLRRCGCSGSRPTPTTARRMCLWPSAVRRRRRIRTLAAPRRCSGCSSRHAIVCSRRSERAHPHPAADLRTGGRARRLSHRAIVTAAHRVDPLPHLSVIATAAKRRTILAELATWRPSRPQCRQLPCPTGIPHALQLQQRRA